MSTLTVTNIKATGETASRAVSGVSAAWVNFNGTGTIATRDSVNVSSLTDNGTGDYTFTFSDNMGNVNYSISTNGTADNGGWTGQANVQTAADKTRVTGSVRVYSSNTISAALNDFTYVYASIHGDLA